jgi:hypothetical protein
VTVVALVMVGAVLVLASGCGGDEEEPPAPRGPAAKHFKAVERDPYAITCHDVASQSIHRDYFRLVVHAEFALAEDPVLAGRVAEETPNRVGRSVYYGFTEVCKGREPSFKPAKLAVEGVRRGTFLAARNRPG